MAWFDPSHFPTHRGGHSYNSGYRQVGGRGTPTPSFAAPAPIVAYVTSPTRTQRLNEIFERIRTNKENNSIEFKRFCEDFPLGADLHNHSGCHHSTILTHAKLKNLFWDTIRKTFLKEPNEDCIPAGELELPSKLEMKKEFIAKLTQPKFAAFNNDRQDANDHFHATFIASGSAEVPLAACLVDEYNEAIFHNIQHVLLMIDLPPKESTEEYSLPTDIGDLTDEALERFYKQITPWLKVEVPFSVNYLKQQGADATRALKLPASIYGTENPINISCQIEIGKSHSLNSTNSDPQKLLARFACDVAKAMELQQTGDVAEAMELQETGNFVLSLNCVGPEYLTENLEPHRARILDFFYKKYAGKVKIAYHAGELRPVLAPATPMVNVVDRILDDCHSSRAGHATCVKSLRELKRLRESDVPVEVCASACAKLLGEPYPFMRLVEAGVPFVICTDNREVFKTNLSQQFYKIFKLWRDGTYVDFKTIARNSLHYSDLKGKSIFDKNDGEFKIKQKYKHYVKMSNVEEDVFFQGCSPKAKVQIRHERAMYAYEEELLSRNGKPLSSSPPSLAFAQFEHLYSRGQPLAE